MQVRDVIAFEQAIGHLRRALEAGNGQHLRQSVVVDLIGAGDDETGPQLGEPGDSDEALG